MIEVNLDDSYIDFNMLTVVKSWIRTYIKPAKIYSHYTSYGLKHMFEKNHSYITNETFKLAMLLCGYRPKDLKDLNWKFKIVIDKEITDNYFGANK